MGEGGKGMVGHLLLYANSSFLQHCGLKHFVQQSPDTRPEFPYFINDNFLILLNVAPHPMCEEWHSG